MNLSHSNKMEYALYTERLVTSRTSLFFTQTSLLASIKGTYYMSFVGVNVHAVCYGRIGETGMVIWINMCRAIEFIAPAFDWQEIENIASI
jgi:hypothetical protein